MLDVRRLRVLREVAARGSFSAAAEALSYTQSAISQQVAAIQVATSSRMARSSSVMRCGPLGFAGDGGG